MTELTNDERIVLLIEQAEKQQSMIKEQQNLINELIRTTLEHLRNLDSKYKIIEKI